MDIDQELKKHFIARLVENGRRIDGRKFDEVRELKVETNIIDSKAEGSALVNLGGTEVLCGVKVIAGEPWSDQPDTGILMTGAELVPIASPEFEAGRPGEDAIELARVVDRGIRESKMIDFEKLVIKSGEKVWMVCVDLHVLNHNGNLLDASSMAAVAALKTTWLPKFEDGAVVREKSGDLPLKKDVVSCTYVKIGDSILFDPILDEEFGMDARLTVVTDGKEVNAMQKGGTGFFRPDEIINLVDTSMSNYKKTIKKLK